MPRELALHGYSTIWLAIPFLHLKPIKVADICQVLFVCVCVCVCVCVHFSNLFSITLGAALPLGGGWALKNGILTAEEYNAEWRTNMAARSLDVRHVQG